MSIELAIYLSIGFLAAIWYAQECAKTDRTQKDRTETAIGAAALVLIWPIALVVRAWRVWE